MISLPKKEKLAVAGGVVDESAGLQVPPVPLENL